MKGAALQHIGATLGGMGILLLKLNGGASLFLLYLSFFVSNSESNPHIFLCRLDSPLKSSIRIVGVLQLDKTLEVLLMLYLMNPSTSSHSHECSNTFLTFLTTLSAFGLCFSLSRPLLPWVGIELVADFLI